LHTSLNSYNERVLMLTRSVRRRPQSMSCS
jgi:hypothetical protein